MNQKEQVVMETLKGMSIEKLCELWLEVDKKEITVEVAKVRGWIIDAMEAVVPEKFDTAFNDWLDAEIASGQHLDPTPYFIN